MIAFSDIAKLAGVRTGIALLQRASCVMGAEMANRITRIVTAVALARTMGIAEFGIAMAALTVHELVRMFIQNGLGTRIVTASDSELPQTAQAVHRLNWALGLTLCTLQLMVAWPIALHFASETGCWIEMKGQRSQPVGLAIQVKTGCENWSNYFRRPTLWRARGELR